MFLKQISKLYIKNPSTVQKVWFGGTMEKNYEKTEEIFLDDSVENTMLSNGTVYISNSIDVSGANSILKKLDYLETRFLCEDETELTTVRIVIFSDGGDLFSGLAIYDKLVEMQNYEIKIVTECRGETSSLALLVSQAGDYRTSYPHTRFMFHEISSESGSKDESCGILVARSKETVFLQDQWFELLAQKTKKTGQELQEMCSRNEYWFSAKEALELGFIDEII